MQNMIIYALCGSLSMIWATSIVVCNTHSNWLRALVIAGGLGVIGIIGIATYCEINQIPPFVK